MARVDAGLVLHKPCNLISYNVELSGPRKVPPLLLQDVIQDQHSHNISYSPTSSLHRRSMLKLVFTVSLFRTSTALSHFPAPQDASWV